MGLEVRQTERTRDGWPCEPSWCRRSSFAIAGVWELARCDLYVSMRRRGLVSVRFLATWDAEAPIYVPVTQVGVDVRTAQIRQAGRFNLLDALTPG